MISIRESIKRAIDKAYSCYHDCVRLKIKLKQRRIRIEEGTLNRNGNYLTTDEEVELERIEFHESKIVEIISSIEAAINELEECYDEEIQSKM